MAVSDSPQPLPALGRGPTVAGGVDVVDVVDVVGSEDDPAGGGEVEGVAGVGANDTAVALGVTGPALPGAGEVALTTSPVVISVPSAAPSPRRSLRCCRDGPERDLAK